MPQTAGASGYWALAVASDKKPSRFQWPYSITLAGFIKIKRSSWAASWFWWLAKIRGPFLEKKVQLYWCILLGPICSGAQSCHNLLLAFVTLSILPLISYHGVPISTFHFSLLMLPTLSHNRHLYPRPCVESVFFHLTYLLTHINSWAPCSTLLALFLRSSYLKPT